MGDDSNIDEEDLARFILTKAVAPAVEFNYVLPRRDFRKVGE